MLSTWKPNSREHTTISMVGNRVFLYGGIGSMQNTNEICILDICNLKLLNFRKVTMVLGKNERRYS